VETPTSTGYNSLVINLPNTCRHCGCKNLKFDGTRTNGRIHAQLRCISCGKILQEWNYTAEVYTDEEEELIRERLRRLGYFE